VVSTTLSTLRRDPFSFLLSKKDRGFTAKYGKDAKLKESNRNLCAGRHLLDMV